MLLSLLIPFAQAQEPAPEQAEVSSQVQGSSVNLEVDAPSTRHRESSLSVQAALLAMDSGGGAIWGLRLDGARNGFVRIDHRTQTSGDSILRGTIGLDLLGWSRLIDLNIGASMATAADLGARSLYGPVGVGLETGFGLNVRSFHLTTRYSRPFGDSPVARGINEREVRLSYDLSQDLSVFGDQLRINPDLRESARVNAYGVGLVYTF